MSLLDREVFLFGTAMFFSLSVFQECLQLLSKGRTLGRPAPAGFRVLVFSANGAYTLAGFIAEGLDGNSQYYFFIYVRLPGQRSFGGAKPLGAFTFSQPLFTGFREFAAIRARVPLREASADRFSAPVRCQDARLPAKKTAPDTGHR